MLRQYRVSTAFTSDRVKWELIIDKRRSGLLFDTTDGVYAHGLTDWSFQNKGGFFSWHYRTYAKEKE
jgi:hypothetical protein